MYLEVETGGVRGSPRSVRGGPRWKVAPRQVNAAIWPAVNYLTERLQFLLQNAFMNLFQK